MNGICTYASPLGRIILSADGACLTGLRFEGQDRPAERPGTKRYRLTLLECPAGQSQPEGQAPSAGLPVLEQAALWLDLYFSGREPQFTPPLCLSGTAFQLTVWRRLLDIPYGHTTTYGELARRIAAEGDGVPCGGLERRTLTGQRKWTGAGRMSARAVGGAAGRNPVALIVPCHRVTGADGRLTGYAGGIERKAKLLALERAVRKR